jgi:hypothetical protein
MVKHQKDNNEGRSGKRQKELQHKAKTKAVNSSKKKTK